MTHEHDHFHADERRALLYALEKYPERIEVAPLSEFALETARQNDRRPAWVKLALPDELVKSLRGARPDEGDMLLVVRVPREVLERSESRIVLPGEVK